jgi:arylsulfatase A-like enzyme
MSVGTSLAATLAPAYGATKNSQPNLLVIHTDEHNFRTLGCYRKLLSDEQAFVWGKGVAVETPNIDWIAEHGATCTSFYATSPVCSPSRAAFVSGKYPQNTPVVGNDIPLRDDLVTFAEVLRRGGYATGYAGKWHLNGTGKPEWAPERQFGFADNRYMFNRGHWKKLEDTPAGPRIAARGKNGGPSYALAGADEKSFATDFLAQKTIDFIDAHSDEPFCYMVSIPDPHGPNSVRAPYDTMYDNLKFELPKTAMKSDEGVPAWAARQGGKKMNAKMMSLYFGMVKCIDDNVGRILTTLREKGILDNTIVVFAADHGDMCFEHARHNKGVPMEASAKVPFVIHYPAKVKAGTVVHEAMGCVDFMPTILQLMGQKPAGTEDGRDYSALFVTGKAPANWKDIAFIREGSKNNTGWFAAVTKRYKLVLENGEQPWLYDLQEDPDELVNYYAATECKEVLKTLSQALIEYGQTYNDPRVLQTENMETLKTAAST